ncbi:MAG: hypothetical protein AAF591_02720 [Verrucomicrobiota bacterium]
MPDPEPKEPASSPDDDFDLGDFLEEKDDDTPAPAPARQPAPPAEEPAAAPKPEPNPKDEKHADAEIPGLADPDTQPPPKRILGLKTVELVSLVGAALLILALLFAFRSTLNSQITIAKDDNLPRSAPTPIKGNLVGIAKIDTHWRPPLDSERVAANQALVPELQVRLTESSGKPHNGFVRIIIRDDQGRIRGDVTTHQIINGNFGDSGSNEKSIVGTEGFERAIDLTGYGMNGESYWSAEVLEGASYAGDAWETLAQFAISHRRKSLGDNTSE